MKRTILFLSVSVMLITVGCQKQINDPAHPEASSQKKLAAQELYAAQHAKLQRDIKAQITEDTKIFSKIIAEYKAKRISSGISAKKMLIQVPRDYASIQEAVDNASDGATINVSGSYTESVVIWNRKNITFNGLGNANLSYGYPFTFGILNSRGIIIKGFNVVGRLAVQDCAGVEIRNNNISGDGNGIDFLHVDSSSIKNNIIQDKIQGVFGGDYTSGGNGILLFKSNHNTIKNNHTSNNYMYGIILLESSQNMIQRNVSQGDPVGICLAGDDAHPYDYELYGSNLNTVYNNEVSGSQFVGFYIAESKQNVLKGNRSNHNSYEGMQEFTSEQTKIIDCIFNNNSHAGIEFFKAAGDLIIGITANNNGNIGIIIGGRIGYSNTIKNSIATGNGICDYQDLGPSNLNISENNRFGSNCSN